MEFDIFISYSRNDFEQVNDIKEEVERITGVRCWMDLNGIETGERFKKVIISAINRSETMLFMLSNNSIHSEWALDELDFAKMKGKRLVILHLEDVQMTDEFYFTYHKYDQIIWNIQQQREKFLRDITKWTGKEPKSKQEENFNNDRYQLLLDENDDPEKLNEIGNELCRYDIRQYADAVKFFKKASEMGYAEAQCNLGTCYEHGRGVLKDYTKAIDWYSKAAERGHGIAQYYLARCYDNTESGYYNHDMALQWYRKAAQRGNPNAQEKLGMCYLDGKGVRKNAKQAVKWLTKAAEQGIETAQFHLGRCYHNGTGIPKNIDEAYKWYSKAAIQGHLVAQHIVSMRNKT